MCGCDAVQAAGLARSAPRKEWPAPVLKQVLAELVQETPRHLLARELWCGTGSASQWWAFQAGYTSSTAAMSMVSLPLQASASALRSQCQIDQRFFPALCSCGDLPAGTSGLVQYCNAPETPAICHLTDLRARVLHLGPPTIDLYLPLITCTCH